MDGVLRALLLAGLVTLTVAAPSVAAPDPWAALHRPLRLAPLAPGAACPATAARPLDHGRLGGALGPGPVYPLPAPFGPDGRHPGWIGSKTLWAWPPRLRTQRTRVLVRGIRLDAPGAVRFQLGPDWQRAPLTRELRLDTTMTVGSFGGSSWGATVAMIFVRKPGCYGLQLDFAGGTGTLVVRAARR